MSLLNDWKNRELAGFGGAWLNRDRSMITPQGAILSQNVEYLTGSVGTRHGFREITDFTTNFYQTLEMYSWLAPFSAINTAYTDNALVVIYVNGDTVPHVTVQNLHVTVSNGVMGSFTLARPAGFNFPIPWVGGGSTALSVGMNLFITVFDQNQGGVCPATVVRMFQDPANPGSPLIAGVGGSSAPGGDPDQNAAFPGPSTYAPPVSFVAGSFTTPGVHRFGYLIEYQTGFTTRVSPDSNATIIPTVTTFAPMVATVPTGSMVQFVFAANWASLELGGITAISMVMTTTTNLNQYYVVPGSRTLNDGKLAVTINVDISDGDLSSRGTDATPYLYWLTMTANNASSTVSQPFAVRHLALWADRMVYLASVPDNRGNLIDALYVSERNNYQAITADQHVLQLPGQKMMVTMFRMGSVNYIVGPHEIWGMSDNGDVPVTWAAPGLVDGRHGTLAIHGAEVAPSGDRTWIADQAGLFLFTGGPMLDSPISDYQTPDWGRINWSAAYAVRIKDDSASRRVCVTVPLDGATLATHVMTWDYTDGLTSDSVRYSLNFITVSGGTLLQQPIGAIELIRNNLVNQGGNTGRVELWLGIWFANADLGTAHVLRHMSELDVNPYRDLNYGIDSKWSGPPLPGRDMGQSIIQHHHGFHARLRGIGTVTPVLRDIDDHNSFPCRSVTLNEGPDQDELVLADLINELAYVTLETKLVDTYFRLAFLRWYYTPYIMQR
jgi:hypothetical protein